MKKLAMIVALAASLVGNSAFAQNTRTGVGASQACTINNNGFAWGIGLGGLAVLGAVVGVTAATASSSHFSH